MARAALPGRLTWHLASVTDTVTETPRVRSIVLDCPGWPGHLAGQHVDVRLTAPDGYQAQRSYSIASAPEDDRLVLTVERLADGEVSPYLVDEVRPGDQLELRGPIGGYFTWQASQGGPLLLVAGGTGVVPFRAMLRHRRAAGSTVPTRLLYSARSLDEVVYADELMRLAAYDEVDVHLTSPGHGRKAGGATAAGSTRSYCARSPGRGRPAPDLRLRPDRLRRGGRQRAGRPRTRPSADQNRTLRPHGRRMRSGAMRSQPGGRP